MRLLAGMRLLAAITLALASGNRGTRYELSVLLVSTDARVDIGNGERESDMKTVHESVVRGHHIYKRVWSPIIGELCAF